MSTLTSNKQLAQDILSQLGGRQFLAMTGVKNLYYDHQSLCMKLKPNKSHAKYLRITLNSMDTYDLTFSTINPNTGHSGGSSKRDGIKYGGASAWQMAMGIDWMNGDELAQAIPPAYTKFIGEQLLNYIYG